MEPIAPRLAPRLTCLTSHLLPQTLGLRTHKLSFLSYTHLPTQAFYCSDPDPRASYGYLLVLCPISNNQYFHPGGRYQLSSDFGPELINEYMVGQWPTQSPTFSPTLFPTFAPLPPEEAAEIGVAPALLGKLCKAIWTQPNPSANERLDWRPLISSVPSLYSNYPGAICVPEIFLNASRRLEQDNNEESVTLERRELVEEWTVESCSRACIARLGADNPDLVINIYWENGQQLCTCCLTCPGTRAVPGYVVYVHVCVYVCVCVYVHIRVSCACFAARLAAMLVCSLVT